MNTKTGLLGGLCAVSVAVAALMFAQNSRLRQQQAAMQSEIQALSESAIAQQHSERTEPDEPLSQNERLELMRLRNEVTQLRATASAARDALKSLQNRAMTEQRLAENAAQPVGQAQEPDAGEPQNATYDPLAFYRKNPELMKRYFPHLYRAEVEGQQPPQPIQTDAAEPAPDAAADPLAFYRKNPELMKRYFPHLIQAEQEASAETPAGGTAGPLPPDTPE